MDNLIERASVLVEALPYIKNYYGKIMVVKYGGKAMVDEDLKKSVLMDIVLMKYVGINPVLVHGGGPEITATMQKMGKEPEFIGGLRVTDKETMEIVEMVLAGKINKEIVSIINQQGGKAVGISGKDANLFVVEKYREGKVDLGYVGKIKQINPQITDILIKENYIPVISSIGVGTDGETYNINADSVAGKLAGALRACKLIILTDVEGVLEDYQDKSSLISELSIAKAKEMIKKRKIDQGMIPKVEACIEALQAGVDRAHIIDGCLPHAILIEVFTDKGIGTMIMR